MTSKLLTPEDVHAVGVAALENALALMADATTLLLADRPLRAFALGVIGVEEAAKFLVCRDVLQTRREITVVDLNRALRPLRGREHIDRYVGTLQYLSALTPWVPLPPGVQDLESMAREDMRVRERVLYVEVASSGAPMSPTGVNEGEVRMWLDAMIAYFTTLAGMWRSTLDDALEAARDPRRTTPRS